MNELKNIFSIQRIGQSTTSMKLVGVFAFLILLVLAPMENVDALQQTANTVVLDIKPGQTQTFQWGLISDKEDEVTTVEITAEGKGAEFLSFQESVEIPPEELVMLTITVSIPDDYPGGLELKPILYGIEYGSAEVGNTVFNIRMGKTVNLNIGLNDNPDLMSLADTSISSTELETQPTGDEGGGCLIATATFGSELAQQVQLLREIRDNTVLSTQSGTAFMAGFNQMYYSFSPTVADWERQNPAFKELVKITLTPLLTSLSILNYVDIDSEERLLSIGISVIALNLAMYVAVPVAVVYTVFRHLKNRIRK